MKTWLLVIAVVLSTTLAGLFAETEPAPEPSAAGKSWQMDFTFEPLQAISIQLPGKTQPETFWYVRYTVANHTGEDHTYMPDFSMYTQSGQLMPSERNVPSGVFAAIQKLHNDPLLRTSAGMTGKLLQGDDNLKRSVAIWPDFDAASAEVTVFAGGLSGETAQIVLPKPITKEYKTLDGKTETTVKTTAVLSKTLSLTFAITTDASSRTSVAPKLTANTWVMR